MNNKVFLNVFSGNWKGNSYVWMNSTLTWLVYVWAIIRRINFRNNKKDEFEQ